MRRRFRPGWVVGGAVLALAAAGVWVRSEEHADAIVAYAGGRLWAVRTGPGCVRFGWGPGARAWHHVDYAGDGYFDRAFSAGSRMFFHVERTEREWMFWVPLWAPMVVGALVMARGVPWGRDPMAGHCAGCGYDLLGNVSGVCPECGRVWRQPEAVCGPMDGEGTARKRAG